MIRTLVVSPRAEEDLTEIWVYSFHEWGEEQADRYLDELEHGMNQCCAQPARGKDRASVRAGYWSRLVRKHVVFYTFDDREVRVQRVLHGRMDPSRHVES